MVRYYQRLLVDRISYGPDHWGCLLPVRLLEMAALDQPTFHRNLSSFRPALPPPQFRPIKSGVQASPSGLGWLRHIRRQHYFLPHSIDLGGCHVPLGLVEDSCAFDHWWSRSFRVCALRAICRPRAAHSSLRLQQPHRHNLLHDGRPPRHVPVVYPLCKARRRS